MAKTVFAYGMALPEVEGFVPLPMNSLRSMLDADIIVIEPSFDDFRVDGTTYRGLDTLSEHSSARYKEARDRWKSQIAASLNGGKNIFVFLRRRQEYYYYTGDRKNAGTAGRPVMQTIVNLCTSYNFVQFIEDKITVAEGSSIKLTGEGREFLKEFWAEFGEFISYQCYFEKRDNWVDLATTKGGEHVVACYAKVGSGNIVLLPELTWGHLDGSEEIEDDAEDRDDSSEDDDEEKSQGQDEGWPPSYELFSIRLRDALLKLDRKLARPEEEPAPDWVADAKYRLPKEDEVEAEIRSVTEQVDVLRYRQQDLQVSLRDEIKIKSLLFGTGPDLEDAVRCALKEIGFSVDYVADGDSEFDAVFVSEEGRFLGEVEGKDRKPIDISKASQLNRNIGEDFSKADLEEVATGVLFGNAYRLNNPSERGDFFTPKVLSFVSSMGMVLVKTPDLFRIVQYVRASGDLDFALECRRAILNHKGRVVTFPDIPIISAESDLAAVEQIVDKATSKGEIPL